MALNFQGTTVTPKRGVNLSGRKTTGVRLSVLKKGQKAITIGEDVLGQLDLGDLSKGVKVVIQVGSGAAWGGKLMVQPKEDGPFTLRYVNGKKKSAAHIMSSALPFDVSNKAAYKVYPEDKAIVIVIPATNESAAPAADPAAAPAPTGDAAAATDPAAEPTGDAAPAPAAEPEFAAE